MKQHILIVEDDISQNNNLNKAINSHYPTWETESSYTYYDALDRITNSIQEKPYTLFLFDVQLSKENGNRGGFLLAEKLRTFPLYYKTPILFLTAISDEGGFALSNYHCYNYIAKPYRYQDIINQLEQMLITGYLESTFDICDCCRIHHNISLTNINYIESKGHTLVIYLENDSLTTREYNLGSILTVLGCDFIQVHKRYIINEKKITHIDKTNMCVNINSFVIPIGRAYKSNLNI